MIDPDINIKNFKKDFENGMSAFDLKKKYILTPRQYRKLKENIKRKKPAERKKIKIKRNVNTKFDEPYISIDVNSKKYAIRKNNIYYGMYETLEIAKKIKERLIKEKWDKSKLNEIRYEFDLKPIVFRK